MPVNPPAGGHTAQTALRDMPSPWSAVRHYKCDSPPWQAWISQARPCFSRCEWHNRCSGGTVAVSHCEELYPSQRCREKVRDGEGVKKNKLVRDPQFPTSEHQRVVVEASREQSTFALDIGLKYDK